MSIDSSMVRASNFGTLRVQFLSGTLYSKYENILKIIIIICSYLRLFIFTVVVKERIEFTKVFFFKCIHAFARQSRFSTGDQII